MTGMVHAEERQLVLTEYPKSGGSWIVSMLGDALGVPCRDVYVRDDYAAFEVRRHPWYEGASDFGLPAACVIKSHELPRSSLLDPNAIYVHLVRDGRDVAVSKYFFERDFCVRNGILESFETPFDEYVRHVAVEWANYVHAWREEPNVVTIRYEAFLADTFGSLESVLRSTVDRCPDSSVLNRAVTKFDRKGFARALAPAFRHNTFVRKAVSGDWKNHFSVEDHEAFMEIAGSAMRAFGYADEGSQ